MVSIDPYHKQGSIRLWAVLYGFILLPDLLMLPELTADPAPRRVAIPRPSPHKLDLLRKRLLKLSKASISYTKSGMRTTYELSYILSQPSLHKTYKRERIHHIVKGRQPERRVLDRIGYDRLEAFITLRLLTSLQPMVCRMLWVLRAGDRLIRKP